MPLRYGDAHDVLCCFRFSLSARVQACGKTNLKSMAMQVSRKTGSARAGAESGKNNPKLAPLSLKPEKSLFLQSLNPRHFSA